MIKPQQAFQKPEMLDVMEVIYKRRSIRSYKADPIGMDKIHTLLTAAVQAPTAIHEEPWEFVVIQDKELLSELSRQVNASMNKEVRTRIAVFSEDPGFNVFYDAGTLIVVYGYNSDPFAAADCWLASENLMLAACSMGLGTCVIGLAISALNSVDWKSRLGVPEDRVAIAPIVVGVPAGEVPVAPRKKPEIIAWKK